MAGARHSRRGASRSEAGTQHRGGPLLRGYLAGFASGLFAAFLVYLSLLPPESPREETAARAAATPAALPQPQYEFYELLPKAEPEPEPEPDGPTLAPRAATTDRARYLLQAGAFRDPEDADRRRAELLLLGLEPAVEVSEAANGRWYRVILGPFESRSAMARARSLTAQQEIDTLLMQRQPAGA